MFISIFKMDYSITATGYNNEVDNFVEIDGGYESLGTFHTTSVISFDRITYLQYLLGNRIPTVTVTAFPDYYYNLEVSDFKIMNYLMKDESLNSSLVVGISNSGYDIDYESYLTVYLTWNYLEAYTLKIGDKILDIKKDGVSIDINDIRCGHTVVFTVLRGEEVLDFELTRNQVSDDVCGIGISVDYFTDVISSEVDYRLIDTVTSGSSGGLMQSLYIYDRLTSFDHTHGLKIAGTGTIDINGNVGAIGGVEQKVYTSIYNDIDIFFVPFESDNYNRAMEVYRNTDTDMIIVGVSNFSQAVSYLENYQGGASDD